jgi:hypothetical protein
MDDKTIAHPDAPPGPDYERLCMSLYAYLKAFDQLFRADRTP